jgi:hypothetical protein
VAIFVSDADPNSFNWMTAYDETLTSESNEVALRAP